MAAKWGKKGKQADKRPVEVGAKPERISNKLDHLLVAESKIAPAHIRTYKKVIQFVRSNRRIVVPAVLLTIILVASLLIINRPKPAPVAEKPSRDLTQITNTKDVGEIVKQYGSDFGSTSEELKNSNSTKWDKAMLDKAYFSLLYADKVGAFTQVFATLSKIEGAKRSGLNIDDNSYEIDQRRRDEILKRAEANAKKLQAGQLGGSSE